MKFRFYTYFFFAIFLIEISIGYQAFANDKNDNEVIETYKYEPADCGTSDYRYFKLKLQISNENEKDSARYELVDIETKLKAKGFKVLQVDYLKFEIIMFSEDPQNAFDFLKSNFEQLEEIDIECLESTEL